jgi:hypothetical protein
LIARQQKHAIVAAARHRPSEFKAGKRPLDPFAGVAGFHNEQTCGVQVRSGT